MVWGIYVDVQDNAYVCTNNSVQVISKDGGHLGTLIGPTAGLKGPYSIAVRESDGTLVIGCNIENIFLFKLS